MLKFRTKDNRRFDLHYRTREPAHQIWQQGPIKRRVIIGQSRAQESLVFVLLEHESISTLIRQELGHFLLMFGGTTKLFGGFSLVVLSLL